MPVVQNCTCTRRNIYRRPPSSFPRVTHLYPLTKLQQHSRSNIRSRNNNITPVNVYACVFLCTCAEQIKDGVHVCLSISRSFSHSFYFATYYLQVVCTSNTFIPCFIYYCHLIVSVRAQRISVFERNKRKSERERVTNE